MCWGDYSKFWLEIKKYMCEILTCLVCPGEFGTRVRIVKWINEKVHSLTIKDEKGDGRTCSGKGNGKKETIDMGKESPGYL